MCSSAVLCNGLDHLQVSSSLYPAFNRDLHSLSPLWFLTFLLQDKLSSLHGNFKKAIKHLYMGGGRHESEN